MILAKHGVKGGVAEIKDLATGERIEVPLDEVATWLADKVIPKRA